ncbi:RHS repeat-associated core domain-containing protein [Micromonospora sp. NPDC049662]|uniref:RHS repeat domain-containing protein n=1 Tax=Micromonospora sp. NPDC049662 TaxID=3155397 RepID=UPI003413ED4B
MSREVLVRVRNCWLLVVAVVVATVVASAPPGLAAPAAGSAEGKGWSGKPAQRVLAQPRGADPEAKVALRKAPEVVWPAAGIAEVPVPREVGGLARADASALVRAGALPVKVGASTVVAGAATDPGTARVEVFDRATTARVGARGMVLRIGHTDKVARQTTVEVDYSGFRQAYGGDYASRLGLVRLPDCALTTPAAKGCRTGTAVPSRNAVDSGLLRAEVGDGLYAVTAAPEGSAGSFRPTSLAPSATWQVGLQSGDFSWSYPVSTPNVPGPTPEIALRYSSGSVDGRVASTNNQPSWLGEGFDYQPGFIERSYVRCGDDGGPTTSGDLCWATDNATVVLPGLTSELVYDAGKDLWRAEQDDGWRVDRLGGAPNGARDGEYWRLASPEGTLYYFGRERLPEGSASSPTTGSTWTVPVFGNGTGEPCHGATFEASWCQQAYRWNLDFVVDRHNDVMSYWYAPETNHYGRAGRTDLPTPYVRGGQPTRIDYGQRIGSVYTAQPAARVVFTPADRCVPGTSCVRSQPQNWPDTPWDQWCDTTGCLVLSPTFWSTRRLSKITTQVVTGGAARDADSWTFGQSYPVPADRQPAALWLDSITRAGLVGGTATLPAVTFDGQPAENRVDRADTRPAMYKRRISSIYTETGGLIQVAYQPTECRAGTVPAVDSNEKRCFPAIWGTTPTEDWFHKYVVSQVTESDLVGGNPPKTTSYEYVFGGSGWHHDDAELVPAGRKSWGQWRGYQRVKVRTGAAGGRRTLTEHLFMRGMDGDVNRTGQPDQVGVDGEPDLPMWRGFNRSVTVFDGDGGALVSRTVAEPRDLGITAQRPRVGGTGGTLEAHLTDLEWERVETALAGGGVRTTERAYTYDARGRLIETHDRGDVAEPGDDTCSRVEYAENTTDWVVSAVKRELTLGVACDAAGAYPTDLVAEKRYYHDGNTTWGAPPTAGDVTRVEEAQTGTGGPTYVTTSRRTLDQHGRPKLVYDALDEPTRTTYTPSEGGPLTRTVVTDALGFTTTTEYEPLRGVQASTTDTNGGTTTRAYDPLGRITRVWRPGRSLSAPANVEFSYTVRSDGPSAVLTRTLLGGSSYQNSYEIFDGLLRQRQTQRDSPRGGRIVTDTQYDPHGRVAVVVGPRHDPGPVNGALAPDPQLVTAQTVYGYDGADRPTSTALQVLGEDPDRWRTTTAYGGDRISTTPPAGGTATTEVLDAHGRRSALRQYAGPTPTGGFDETLYQYAKGGQLATVTDPAGNVWRYGYDLSGRRVREEAPDTGTTLTGYDARGQVTSVRDGRGQTVAYRYDPLGRRTGAYTGSTDGPQLAEWTYDTATLGKGLPASAVRYVAGQRYETRVVEYDLRGRRTATAVVIPATETGLAGTYPTTYTYNEGDQVTSTGLPAAGDLPAETLRQGYDNLGFPTSLTSPLDSYVAGTSYTNLGEPEESTLGPAGQQVVRGFGYQDGTRALTQSTVVLGEDLLAATVHEYDPAGDLTRAADLATGDDQCFRYDRLRRLTEAWAGSGDCTADPATGDLAGPAPYWQSYAYDPTGNRTRDVRHAAAGDVTRTYTYPAPAGAQPHTLRTVDTTGPTGNRSDGYGYDAAGNATGRPGQSLTWDVEGRVASVTTNGQTTSYIYDADGNRLIRRDAGGSTLYLGDTELRRSGAATTGNRYYRHDGETIALRVKGGVTRLIPDQRGTAVLAVDAATQQVTRRHTLPFGDPRGGPVNWPGGRGFLDGGVDPLTGLTHLGARDYDPGTGRFDAADPVVDHQDSQQVNGYAYANNNPTTFTDPDGRRVRIPEPYDSLFKRLGVADPVRVASQSSTGKPVPRPQCHGGTCSVTGVINGPAPVRESDSWVIDLPIFEVYPRNYGRDIRESRWSACDSGDPAPAIACAQRPDPAPRVVYQWQERDCVGWNDCLSPRPYENVRTEIYDDEPDGGPPRNSIDIQRFLHGGTGGGTVGGTGRSAGGWPSSGGVYYLG